MKLFLAVFLMLSPVMVQSATDSGSAQPAAVTVVRGSVLLVDGEYLVVKEMSGREVRVHVSADTKLEGLSSKVKAGDKIEAMVTPEGHATSIALQVSESGPVPPGMR